MITGTMNVIANCKRLVDLMTVTNVAHGPENAITVHFVCIQAFQLLSSTHPFNFNNMLFICFSDIWSFSSFR